ncbi:MAG: hypothetical protein NWE95_01825 [Candidatus Bathyarchaeota archaeon]|nr:hypothetical protein [Candidatus Bathyarchaeota archaeon]
MSSEPWPPLVKLLLAISEKEPISGNGLISYLVQQLRVSRHTYVKARKSAISQGLIKHVPTGKGRSAQYLLTEAGRAYLHELEESTVNQIKGFSHNRYWFRFGEGELGRIDFSIKSNLPAPFLNGKYYQEGILELLFNDLSQHVPFNPRLPGQPYSKEEFDIDTEINVRISAKRVDGDIVSLMRELWDAENDGKLENPTTIMEIDKTVSRNPESSRKIVSWYLSNVFGRLEPDLEYEEEKPEEWWLAPFPWEIFDFDSKKSDDPGSCDYWGSFIFERKEEATRNLQTFFMYVGAKESNLMSLKNVLLFNREFLGSEIDDSTFLNIWEKVRGRRPSPVDYASYFADEPFHVFGLSSLIDEKIYKKWVLVDRPRECTHDIASFLIAVFRKAFRWSKKRARKTWREISQAVLRYAEDYVRQTRFDIIEKSQG